MKQICGCLLLILLLSGCGSGRFNPVGESAVSGTTIPPLPTLEASQITQGKVVYDTHCASCHGANLEGVADWKTPNPDGSFRPPPHDDTGHTWHHPDSVLIKSIREGGQRLLELNVSSNMPAFAEVLTVEEITAVLTYIKSSWTEENRQFQWEATNVIDNP